MSPTFSEELKLCQKGCKFIAGVDEVGRGPLAGSVMAAAVVFPATMFEIECPELKGINDSKKMTLKKREEIYETLTTNENVKWALGSASEKVIDDVGIYKATQLAMLWAIEKLSVEPDFVIIDGREFRNELFNKYKKAFVIRADEKIISCSAASVIAKVTRDKEMQKMHEKYPEYGFDQHKGYGTKLHMEMIKRHGPCPIHRRSFRPIRQD